MDRETFRANRRTVLQGASIGAALLSPGLAMAAPQRDRDAILAAVESDYSQSVARIQDWIRSPSIAAEKHRLEEGAAYMMKLARDAGFQQARVVRTDGAPAIFATLDARAKHTLGLYFMYDVKQYDPAEWSSPPIEARIVDRPGEGKAIMGRGAVNQKGPQAAFLAALHAFKASGRKLPVNLVLIAEGEEEMASPHFPQVVADAEVAAALRKTVGVFMPAAGQGQSGHSAITLGAKGAVEFELVSDSASWGRGPAKDIHSSQFARVDSPAWRLVQALGTLMAPDGHTPAVEGWFELVKPLTPRQKALVAEMARTGAEADAKKSLGVQRWIKDEDWQTSIERLLSQPTINIQGLVGGYTGPGGKTILPHRVTAKMELRLVPDMTKEDSVEKLKAHLAKRGFPDIEVNVSGGYGPNQTSEDTPVMKAQKVALTRAGIPYAVIPRNPGSWPGVVFTAAPLSLPAGQFGIGRGGGAHAPDEYYIIESSDPKIAGLKQSTAYFVDLLYEIAAQA